MKKLIPAVLCLIFVLSLAGCGTLGTAAGGASLEDTAASTSAADAGSAAAQIGELEAKAIALEHAGVAEADLLYMQVKLDTDDGRTVYDVEFYSGGAEYDYEIDAASGEVVSFDYDIENYESSAASSGTVSDSGSYIGEEQAKSAALTHAGVAEADLVYIQVKLDTDDGRTVYDVEFYSGGAEYDYEIDAVSGEVVSFDYDIESYAAQSSSAAATSSTESYISLDEAKEIALGRAGVSASAVTYKETSLEYDDGRAEYKIEFISGTREYEVEIDALSGSVTGYDEESVYD
ncbi:MAG: PepSY domain-containing protein [Oscillospiraceae bacterium]|nr:PepSY domain-containing protein [Oscillospiraceae bacterium]